MITCLVAQAANEFTGLSDTLIESQWETRSAGNNFAGADYSTFFSTLNSSYLSQYNSYTETHGVYTDTDSQAHTIGSDVYVEGMGYFSAGPTRTYHYSSGVEYLTVYATGPGTDQTQVTPHPGTGYGTGETESKWDIEGSSTEWSWTFMSRFSGFTSAHYTFGSESSGSYSTFGSVSGSGTKPPRGTWYNQTTVYSTVQITSYGIIDTTVITTAPTGYYHITTNTDGNTGVVTSTIATTVIVDSWQASNTSTAISSQGWSIPDFFFDPDQFYLYSTVYIPVENGTFNEWLYVYSQDQPYTFSDPAVVTEQFYSVDGEVTADPFPRLFPMNILSVFAASDPSETFTCSSINTDITDPIYPIDIIELTDAVPETKTYYYVGSLPMESSTEAFGYQPTVGTTGDAGGWISADATFSELASKTTASDSFSYESVTKILEYIDDHGRNTTTSFFNIYSVAIPSGATQTSADYDYIITDSATYQIPSSGTPVRGGAFVNLEGQTIWGSYRNSQPFIYPADTIYFTAQAFLDRRSVYTPVITTGFQVPPYINNGNPVFERVDANAQISTFDYNFFNAAFAGQNEFDVGVPFQFYYKDRTNGETGVSVFGDYTFSFETNRDSVGQVSVTQMFGDTTNTESFIMQLAGGGDTIMPEIDSNDHVLTWVDHFNSVIGVPLFGGRPNAYGNTYGGDTVMLIGRYDTSDDQGGSGRQDFSGSFEMATDELTAISAVECFTVGTASIWQNSSFAVNVYVRTYDKYPQLTLPI